MSRSFAIQALSRTAIAYCSELNLQVCNYAQKRRICRENSEYAPDEDLCGSFALAERLQTSTTLYNIIDVPNSSITCHILESMKPTLKKGINEINQ